MSLLCILGCERQNVLRDRITVAAGTFTYSTTVPVGSKSSRSIGGSGASGRRPWYDGNGTAQSPVGNTYWFHYQYVTGSNTASNDELRLGVGRNGTQGICVSAEDTTNKVALRIGSTLLGTATSEAFSADAVSFKRVHVFVDHVNGGQVRVYTNGNLSAAVITYTLTGTDITNLTGKPNEFHFVMKGGDGSGRFDDVFALDPDGSTSGVTDINQLLSVSVQPIPFTGNGSYTAWTGTFADIDELPPSDTDFIEATAVGQAETFTHGGTDQARVYGVAINARVTRTGTTAGSNIAFRMRQSSTDSDTSDFAAPGDGDVSHIFQTKVGGGTWTPSDLLATEFGVVART